MPTSRVPGSSRSVHGGLAKEEASGVKSTRADNRRKNPCYDFFAQFLLNNPNEWYKVSPLSMNGRRKRIERALDYRLGSYNVEVKESHDDVWARLR